MVRSDTEREVSRKRKLKLVEAGDVIFEDADDDFRSIDRVAQHFETYVQQTHESRSLSAMTCVGPDMSCACMNRWKRTHHKDYMTAFVSLGLPKIFEPFVRLEMVRWEPLTNAVLGASFSPLPTCESGFKIPPRNRQRCSWSPHVCCCGLGGGSGLGEGDSSLENFGWYTRLFNYGQGEPDTTPPRPRTPRLSQQVADICHAAVWT